MFEWKNIFRGMAMGASDIIPGVSGGTIALVLGIYHRLIEAINNFFTRRWKQQLGFFIPLGIGILIAIFSLSKFLKWLLASYPQPTFFLFIGLILGTIPFLLKEADYKYKFTGQHYLILAIAAGLVILSGVFQGEESAAMQPLSTGDYVLLFFSGWLASTAMILPGISGSFILLIIGVYTTVLNAVSTLNIPVLLTLGAGIILGLVIMSKFLHYLLRHHTTGTYAVMTGLLVGSLFVIFPGLDASFLQLIISIITLLTGLFVAITLGKIERA
ncbi:DUF368 domain-containing protein [Salibacterium salarium]|uniref:DUF368 domain-containing protein n=1 Tax=Salibacterium salarium TaxID=284579 RepID=A0A428MUS3_9BACI|nr:DUF368 domain-containing protein [Salibacterium salarium]RSL29870.1 DUF368 domain-containing protein [Salibacterium salarium]